MTALNIPAGAAGVGVPPGGAVGQLLTKQSGSDFDTAWVNPQGVKRVLQEQTRNTNMAAITAITAYYTFTFNVVAGRQYFIKFGGNIAVSTSLFHQMSVRLGTTAGAQLWAGSLVQSNLIALWWEVECMLAAMAAGSQTVLFCNTPSTGNSTLNASATALSYCQLLDREALFPG